MFQAWSNLKPETWNLKTVNSSHHLTQHQQNDKHDEQSQRDQHKAQAWIIRSFFDNHGRSLPNLFDALRRFFDYAAAYAASDFRCAMQTLASLFAAPVDCRNGLVVFWIHGCCGCFRDHRLSR